MTRSHGKILQKREAIPAGRVIYMLHENGRRSLSHCGLLAKLVQKGKPLTEMAVPTMPESYSDKSVEQNPDK